MAPYFKSIQTPIKIKMIPEKVLIILGDMSCPRRLPNRTPKLPARHKASTVATKTEIVDFDSEAAANAAICVLSPISAIKIAIKVVLNTVHSMFTSEKINSKRRAKIFKATLSQKEMGSSSVIKPPF